MTVKWKKLREGLNRISGIELPVFGGLSWQHTELEVTKVHKLFAYLEDKRMLYYEEEWEFMPHVIQSVLDIRAYIEANILRETDNNTLLHYYGKVLRDACLEFLDFTEQLERYENAALMWQESNYKLMALALGRIRRRFGGVLQVLAAQHKVDVNDNLATIMPASPNHDEKLLSEEWPPN